MFDLEDLLADLSKHNTPPTRKPANPQETASRTIEEVAGSEPATHPQAPATHPQTPATSTPLAGDLRVMRVDAGNLLAHDNAVQDEEKPNLAGLRVGGVFAKQQPTLPMGWAYLLEQVEPLAARLVELQAPVLRLDVEHVARGYQSIEGMDFEGVAKLLRRMIEAVAQQYPRADDIHVIAQWPGKWPEKTRNEVLAGWESVTL